jgi:hypothetical protein
VDHRSPAQRSDQVRRDLLEAAEALDADNIKVVASP